MKILRGLWPLGIDGAAGGSTYLLSDRAPVQWVAPPTFSLIAPRYSGWLHLPSLWSRPGTVGGSTYLLSDRGPGTVGGSTYLLSDRAPVQWVAPLTFSQIALSPTYLLPVTPRRTLPRSPTNITCEFMDLKLIVRLFS